MTSTIWSAIGWLACALAFGVSGSAAFASDPQPCGKDLVCASSPRTVVDALQKAGYKAALGKDKEGDPMIDSQAGGYDYVIFFYGCTEHELCDSIQFYARFTDKVADGPKFTNSWNSKKRFVQMATEGDGVRLTYDMTTVGGLTQDNFADVVDWWDTLLGGLSDFFDDEAGKKKETKK
jgi:hypothetical protein